MKYKVKILSLFFLTLVVLPGFIWMLFTGKIAQALTPSATDAVIYDDALSSAWHNWSWNTTLDFNGTPAKTGAKAIVATMNGWGGLYLHTDQAVTSATTESVVFSLKPTLDGSSFAVLLYDENNAPIGSTQPLSTFGPAPGKDVWGDYIIPLPENHSIKGIAIQDVSGKSNNKIFVDDYFVKKKPTAIVETPTLASTSPAQVSTVVYSEGLANGWDNWSWGSAVNANNYWPIMSGNRSLAFTPNSAWAGLYLHTNGVVDTSGLSSLQFSLYATQANQTFGVTLVNENNQITTNPVSLDKYGTPTANAWKTYTIPLSELAANNRSVKGVIVQEAKGQAQPIVYIDDLSFVSAVGGSTASQPAQTFVNPTATPTTSSANAAPPTTKQFTTLAPGSSLPSGETCASLVRRSSWEPRPENKQANNTKGFQLTTRIDGANAAGNAKYLSRINGNFTGTTDEIIQWGACKWGLDEDIVRSVAAQESWWRQSTQGDWNGTDFESYGLLQVRKTYHFGTFPIAKDSVPFNVDYALGWRRACMDGYFDWIPSSSKGDEWGCVGLWFSGRWRDGDPNIAYSGANWYIKQVQGYLNTKVWLTQEFATK